MMPWPKERANLEGDMKRTFLLLALGWATISAACAQADSTNSPSNPPPTKNTSILSSEEDQEVSNAHRAALSADPSLAATEKELWAKLKAVRDAGGGPNPDLKAELLDFNTKLEAAMVKADPKVEPLLAKLEAAHPHHP